MSMNYPKYEAYKETGIGWLPKVPEGWEVKRFKYHAKVCNGKDQKAVLAEDGVYSIFGSGGEFGRANEYLYNKSSVLLGRKGTIDRPLFVDQPFWTVDTMFYTEISNKTNPRYFYYSCLGIAFDKYQMGSAIPSMTQEDLSGIEFASPPLPEQKAIAAFLDEKTGKIDTLLAKLKRQKELLTEKRTALITRAVTRGLNPNAPMKETGIEWLPQVPIGWKETRIKQIGNVFGRIGFRGYTVHDIVQEGEGAITLSPSNVQNQKFDTNKCVYLSWEKYNESPEIKIYANDIIIVKTGSTIGKVALVTECFQKMTINPQLVVLKNMRENTKYIYYTLINKVFQANFDIGSAGGSTPAISQETINNFSLVLPPLPEQTEIAEYLDTETAKIDLLQFKTDKQMALLQEYRTSLITSAVTGQIKVTDNREQRQCA